MNESIQKMLYVSIKLENNNPYLLFEIEDYFRNSKRQAYTEQIFEKLTKDFLSEDFEGLDGLGFKILNGLLPHSVLKDRYKRNWALGIYKSVYKDPKRSALDLDEEPYRENPNRILCEAMPLESLDPELNIFNDVMRMRVAQKVLKYLPLE